jgi:pSer/pThr/pTyr-binding forkhead associated (FHA) protein
MKGCCEREIRPAFFDRCMPHRGAGMARLIVQRAEGNLEYELRDRAFVGRHPNNSIHVADRLISKEHCLIFLGQNGNYVIRDLGSQNGTFVNNQRLDGDGILRDGDSITLGTTRCIFSVGEARYSSSAGPHRRYLKIAFSLNETSGMKRPCAQTMKNCG